MQNKTIIKINEAIENDDIQELRIQILKCRDINAKPYTDLYSAFFEVPNQSPLSYACFKGNLECVKILVEAGADIDNANNQNHYTPLMDALSGSNHNKKDRVNIVKYLLEHGADVNKTDINNYTALFRVITIVDANDIPEQKTQLEMIKQFESYGSNIYHEAPIGSILFKSSFCSSLLVIKYLIEEKGFDVNSLNSDGDNSLMYTIKKFYYKQYEAVEYLLDKGAVLNIKNIDGFDAFDLAEKTGDEKLLQILNKYR